MEHPESLKNLNSLEVTGDVREFVTQIASDIEEAKSHRGDWEQRVDEWYKKRYSLRGKKTFPWPGAANFVIPLIDTHINSIKPSYVNLAYAVSPVVTFEPFGPEDIEPSRKREALFDWRMRTQVDFFNQYVIGVDKMLERGMAIFKVQWRFETRKYSEVFDLEELEANLVPILLAPEVTDEMFGQVIQDELGIDTSLEENVEEIEKAVKKFREGATKVTLNLLEKSHDEPQVIACDPKEDVVVPVDTQDIQDARFIDYKFWTTKNKIKIAMRDGKYVEYGEEVIESWAKQGSPTTYTRSHRDGVSQNVEDELILMHETCAWYDIDDDGIEEKVIITWPDADPESAVRFIENPYDHGCFPYVQVKRELIDSWFYSSRGIPALDEDFQIGISTKFNQDIDNQTIVNTPVVKARRNAVKNLRNLRYIPGQTIEVDDINDYQIEQLPNISQGAFLTSAQFLKAWSDQRIGNITSGLSSVNNLPGAGEQGKKTAKEVETIAGLQNQVQSLDLQVFQQQMAKVYEQIDGLYDQFGNDEEEIIITGEEPQKVTRREIQGKFNIVPNGRLDNSNPAMRAAKSMMLLRSFLGDPDVRQYELKKQYLDDLDLKLSKKLLLSPQEIQMRDQMMQQQQEALKQKAIGEQVQLRGVSDAMDIRKEAAMTAITGKKYAPG